TPTFDHALLVIDDTRLEPDKCRNGCPLQYTDQWPGRAEFDTFCYARGGFNWRCTRNPTTGVTSTPGLFAGYDFDTLGTRLNLENPARALLLSVLGKYKNVVWFVDNKGGDYRPQFDQQTFPITALMSMSA